MAKSTLRERLDSLQDEYNEQRREFGELIDAIERTHDDEHTEVFRYCTNPVCVMAGQLEYAPESRVLL